jgi:hypothetical protein
MALINYFANNIVNAVLSDVLKCHHYPHKLVNNNTCWLDIIVFFINFFIFFFSASVIIIILTFSFQFSLTSVSNVKSYSTFFYKRYYL